MIRELRIERFKNYSNISLPFRALTVLTGNNGTGKSTVLQSLLLLRQACRNSHRGSVELNGPFGLALGEALDVLHSEADPGDGIALTLLGEIESRFEFEVPNERSQRLVVRHRPAQLPDSFAAGRRDFVYLYADRLGPRDVFDAVSLDEADLNVGVRGEAVAQVLAQLDSSLVHEALIHPETGKLQPKKTLPAQAELWLSSIVTPIQIEARWIPGTSVTTLRFRKPGFRGEWVRPANSGFGLSYALPVIVAGLSVSNSGLLIVENPEAHLHPQGQSAIGAFLARVASTGTQVIIETHSDHVINGVRRAIAIEHALACSDASILFFGDSSSAASPQSSVQPIQVLDNGELSSWPECFFDQIEKDLAALAKVRRRKR